MTEQDRVELERLEKEKHRLDLEQTAAHQAYIDKWMEYEGISEAYDMLLHKYATCESCRYFAVHDLSSDGWHNLCGNSITKSCTCCHSRCNQYKPDNLITKWVKESCKRSLNPQDVAALKILFIDIMKIEDTDYSTCTEASKKIYEKIIAILRIKYGETNNE